MIKPLDITGMRFDVSERLKKYIFKKIGRLDRLMPRQVKKSVHGRVILKTNQSKRKLFTCEVVLELPQQTLMAKESAINVFAAVDIVEAKLVRQIGKYKTQKSRRRFWHKIWRRR